MTEAARPSGQRLGSLTRLLHNLRKREQALADLEEVRKAVFGDASNELADKMRRAIDTLRLT